MNIQDEVKKYYGETLKTNSDLKTDACCSPANMPDKIKNILAQIHDEVLIKYYGCGLTIPSQLEGLKVLDLGSGSGRDCYLLSSLVGEDGQVIGIDMTHEQLEVARRHIDYHTQKFGFKQANVEFREGNIEKLNEVGLEDNFFDVIVSNCVVNLASDKKAVLAEAYRTLKPGGEMYFSDVYADRRIPEELVKDEVLYGECLSGALYWNDFQNLAKNVGFSDPRIVEGRPLEIQNEKVQEKIGDIKFYSTTYRLFKVDGLEPACEDYGQSVIYKGNQEDNPEQFTLDEHHTFFTGRPEAVCGNTYLMLQKSRYKQFFEFRGDFKTHYGIFPNCGTSSIPLENNSSSKGSACC